MEKAYGQLKEFHTVYDVYASTTPHLPNEPIRELRKDLLKEEYEEYLDAEKNNDLVEIADALADIIYIAAGTALSYGIPLDKVWEEVHSSNMSKLDADGNPIRRADGKILKGPTFFPPNITKILEEAKEDAVSETN